MFRRALDALSSQVASGVDQLFYSTALVRNASSRARSAAERLGHAERMEALEKARTEYGRAEYLEDPDSFFPEVGRGEGRLERVRSIDLGVTASDLRWRSDFTPLGAGVAARYAAHPANEVAVARVIRHEHERRPAMVLIHGYLGGEPSVEERILPAAWLREQGFDVALYVLPFHGERRGARLSRPVFPSSDPRFTIEGFRQAVGEVKWLARWLRERGAPSVGVLGMSLGGYTTALLATVAEGLSCAVPLVPLASLADFARDGGRLVGTAEEQAAQYGAMEGAFEVVSPLGRPARLAPDRMVVLAGEADRITPIAHAERLAAHLGAPLERFPGGHLLQWGRQRTLAPLGRLLARVASEGDARGV